MSTSVQPQQGLVIVEAEVFGMHGSAVLRLALDTGATTTLINAAPLAAIGYDTSLTSDRIQVTTGSGIELVPRIAVSRLQALDVHQSGFPVLCHTLPASANIDGLLGLDFLRGRIITLDFQNGTIVLT